MFFTIEVESIRTETVFHAFEFIGSLNCSLVVAPVLLDYTLVAAQAIYGHVFAPAVLFAWQVVEGPPFLSACS